MTLQFEFKGLHRVISGGQTGADQGGLIAAFKAGVETGGTAPLHYQTQDGFCPVLQVFGLSNAGNYASRTRRNVLDSDGTVIIAANTNSPGTVLTKTACKDASKPYLVIDISQIIEGLVQGPQTRIPITESLLQAGQTLKDFVVSKRIGILNVAGNREIKGSAGNAIMPICTSVEWIVAIALELLELDDLLLTKSPSTLN